MENTADSLDPRLARLEQSLWWWRLFSGMALLVALLSLVLAWRVQPDSDGLVSAHGFIVRGSDGEEVARLGRTAGGNGAALTIPGRVMLSGDDAQASLVIFGREDQYLMLQPSSGRDWGVRWIQDHERHYAPLWQPSRK